MAVKKVKVNLLTNVKYGKKCFKIGEELELPEKEAKEYVNKGIVKIIEKVEAKAGE